MKKLLTDFGTAHCYVVSKNGFKTSKQVKDHVQKTWVNGHDGPFTIYVDHELYKELEPCTSDI